MSFVVIPCESNTTIKRPTNILNDFVVFFQGCEQMLEMFVANIFYPEVVNREIKPDGARDVCKQTGSVWLFEVTVWFQAGFDVQFASVRA